MKKLIIPVILITGVLFVNSQTDKTGLLQSLEADQPQGQEITPTATVKTSTRLFKAREDLTSVIMIIPSGSVVALYGSDSTYLHVVYKENEGFIFKKHAIIDKAPATFNEMEARREVQEAQAPQTPADSRYEALERKYGATMAARLYAGKIWKGMNAEMAKDSWGTAEKVNRVISGNVIKEEWIYRSTWLYFENNTLVKWGPVKN